MGAAEIAAAILRESARSDALEAAARDPERVLHTPPGTIRRAGWRAFAMLILVCASVLGQGERYDVDPRFVSPGATLTTYWEALKANDIQTVADCFVDAESALPFPGMLWFLPPVDELDIRSVHLESAERGHLVAVYEVRFRPKGSTETQQFHTSTELRRIRQQWRIVPQSGEAGMPAWRPYPRRVDI